MKNLIQWEEAAMLVASFLLSLFIGYSWWIFFLFLLVPDVSMLGYLFGSKAGAWIYNFIHFKLVAVAIGVAGYLLSVPEIIFAGLILFGHSSMDRIFGYGLKFSDDFKHTHLGWMGDTNKNADT